MSLNVMSTDHALTLLVGLCANAKIAGKGMRATHNESVLGVRIGVRFGVQRCLRRDRC